MCGLAGIWGRPDRAAIEAMVAAMHHRGPDDRGVFQDERVALGSTRLAIVDLSHAGHQPMSNPEGTVWIAYNGEVYNFQTERDVLRGLGYSFSSGTDTEVVLRMYEHYGDDFLLRLRGMFALAVYDRRGGRGRERLLLARDHLGIKPLLVARTGNGLVFASELKALLASGLVAREIDPGALRSLLTFGSVYQPATMLADVRMLLPAHRLIVEDGRERVERWWTLGAGRRGELSSLPYPELVDVVADAVAESVRLQLVADVPLGAFLSGGIDSSLLVALMAQGAGGRVRTFSVGFDAEGMDIDETDEAARTARWLGTDHTRIAVNGEEVRRKIEHIAFALDQPSVDGTNSYFVSQAARTGVTVALSGTGGDELFAGYPWFLSMLNERERDGRAPFRAAAEIAARIARSRRLDRLVPGALGPRLDLARGSAGFVERYGRLYNIFGVRRAARLLAPELRRAAGAGRSLADDLAPLDELAGAEVLDRTSALCLRGYTSNQLLRDIDGVSMAHSLEVRVPYLDHVVADLALSLPEQARVRTAGIVPVGASYRVTGAKRVIVDAATPLLPPGFDDQPKRGFAMPFGSWLRGPLSDVLEDTLSDRSLRSRGLLDVREAASVRDSFLRGEIGWAEPWLLMMIELWCRVVLEGAPRAAGVGVRAAVA